MYIVHNAYLTILIVPLTRIQALWPRSHTEESLMQQYYSHLLHIADFLIALIIITDQVLCLLKLKQCCGTMTVLWLLLSSDDDRHDHRARI